MSDRDDATSLSVGSGEREYGPVALVMACIAAVVLAAALVPLVTADGSGSPAESLVPLPSNADERAPSGELANATGGLGAMNVGDQQSVGGQIGATDGNPFRAQDTQVHFEVRSEEPSYWRTGAFDTYEGDGWSKSAPSDTTAPIDGREVSYEVQLEREAGSPPTVWRPVALEDGDGISLTEGGVASADDALEPGDSYAGVSRKPPRDPSVLGTSGSDYPADVEERYTALPERTDRELGAFTAEVTADAETPYETATAVEAWLESNKEYSLNVSAPRGDDVASQFVFDMDAGYCEYFATSMVAMLRSQDVPARYVVGYSTGQPVGDDTYRVRGMNAHAWVEVYFDEVGWVRFDPTPGSERLEAERESFEESDADGSYVPEEEGSPNETFVPEGVNESDVEPGTETPPTATPPGSDGPGPTTPSTPAGPNETTPVPPAPGTPPEDGDGVVDSYNVSLNRTAVPGAPVEISVTYGAMPVVGAEVSVNGEVVGVTGQDGTVVTTVPHESEFTVTVSGGSMAASSVAGAGVGALDEVQADARASGGAAEVDPDRSVAAAQNKTESFDVETNATLSVSGEVRTGETVVVTATVDDVPVANGAVFLAGERVGETDAAGRAEVTLPSEPGNVTLRVERDPIAGERTLELGQLSLDADPSWPVPVAGTSAEITATVGDDPAAGVPVHVDGERVGETGVNGTVTATLPLASSVSVSAAGAGQTAATTVANPLLNLASVIVVALGLIVAAAVGLSRRDASARDLPALLAAALRALPRRFASALVEGSRLLERGWERLVARARATVDHIAALVRGDRSPEELLTALRAWLADRVAELRASIRRASPVSEPAAAASSGSGGGGPDGARTSIREAWGRFLGYVSVGRAGTKTPGQIASHAVSTDGLPRDAVATLRDEFRAVEYGPRSPDDAVGAVADAVDRIEAAVTADEPADSTAERRGAPAGRGPAEPTRRPTDAASNSADADASEERGVDDGDVGEGSR